MRRNIIETIMGAIVLFFAASFLMTAYESRGAAKVDNGYIVNARFDDVSGISVGSDVRMGGVKIGVVESVKLDTERFQALVSVLIRGDIPIPSDSSAAIVSDGLLGGKFLAIEAGGSEETLAAGDEIEFTQSSISLEQMIGKFMFSDGGVGETADGDGSEISDSQGGDDDIGISIP